MMRQFLFSAALVATAAPAFAQSTGHELPDPSDQSNTFSVAAGVGYGPDYEGSDDQRMIPAVAIRGRVSGFSFWTAGTALYVDVLRRPQSGIDFDLGPILGVRLNRSSDVKDARVDKLPELDPAIELGAFGGVTWHGLTNPYDNLSLRVDVLTDVSGAHKSTLITPSISFGTPLSQSTYVSAGLNAEWAGNGYADYYYSISPAEGVVAGLPAYEADGGFKHWGASLMGVHAITGDLTGGIGVFALAAYKHLSGDFKDSPIVDQRGKAGQLFGAIGLTYTW